MSDQSFFSDDGGYIGMAERLQKIQATPDRFKREPGPAPKKWKERRQATLSKTPRAGRATKSSKMRAMREDNTTNKKEYRHKSSRRVVGAPRLLTEGRCKNKPQIVEEAPKQFKAKPAPKYGASSSNISRMSTRSQTTSIQPFSFDSRPKSKRTVLQEEIKMDLPHKLGEIQDLAGVGISRNGPKRKPTTKIEPFKFQPTKEKPKFDFIDKENKVPQADVKFMKKALAGHKLPEVESKGATVPKEFNVHLTKRGEKRKEFDKKIALNIKEAEKQKEIDKAEEERVEAMNLVRFRENLVHKPEPIREYKPAPEKKDIPLTNPTTPRFSRRLRNKK